MKKGQQFNRFDETSETTSLKASIECDEQMREAMTSPDGMFAAGLLPQVGASSAQGAKQVLDIVGKAG